MTSARGLALEAAILADPEDPAGYLVYADHLQVAGDPRGQLIAVQAARTADDESRQLADAEATLFAAHGAALLGAAADLERCYVDWFYGFWRVLYLGAIGGLAGQPLDDLAAQLLASPSAKFLRALSCVGPFTPRMLELAAPVAATLHTLDLSLAAPRMYDDELRALERFPRLRRLVLGSCASITTSGLAVLGGLRELTRLDLRDCGLTDAIARAICHLPLAEAIFAAAPSGLTADGMRALAAAPLSRFHLGAEQATGVAETRRGTINDALIVPLAAHPTLSDLAIHGAQLTAIGIGAIGSVPRLRRLQLGSSRLDGTDLAPLAPLAGQLESLRIARCASLGDASCHALVAFDRLAFLDVAATAITGAGLRALTRVRSLTQLDLSFLTLDDADIAALADLPNLRCLNLAHTRLTDRAVDTLLQLPRLEKLELGGTQLTAAAIDQLATLPALIDLGLSGCDGDAIAHAHDRAKWHLHARDLIQLDDGLDAPARMLGHWRSTMIT